MYKQIPLFSDKNHQEDTPGVTNTWPDKAPTQGISHHRTTQLDTANHSAKIQTTGGGSIWRPIK